MKRRLLLLWVAGVITAASPVPARTDEAGEEAARPLVLLDGEEIARERRLTQEGRPAPLASRWIREGEAALKKPVTPVTDKPASAVSGSPNDYYSIGIYWWPNPVTGVPYVRRDGIFNPESNRYDRPKLENFSRTLLALARAYAVSDDPRYAERAREWMRVWQIDPATRMNPHFLYAQAWPGWTTGSPTGIIEGAIFARNAPDAFLLLLNAGAIPPDEEAAIRQWYRELVAWLERSAPGKKIDGSRHNHANYYDLQRVAYHRLLGDEARVRAILNEVGPRRIALQIEADGRMPAELRRTKSFDYCCYSLRALVDLAQVAHRLGIDLWHYEAPGTKASLRRALDFLVPYASGKKAWPYQTVTGYRPKGLIPLLREAAPFFPEAGYEEAIEAIGVTGTIGVGVKAEKPAPPLPTPVTAAPAEPPTSAAGKEAGPAETVSRTPLQNQSRP